MGRIGQILQGEINRKFDCNIGRRHFCHRTLRKRLRNVDIALTEEQKKQVREFWKGYWIDGRYFAFFNANCSAVEEFNPSFIPEDMFYCYVDPYFNTPGAEVIDDKNLYGLIFRDLRQPKTIARKIDGLYMDEGYEPLTLQEVIGRCMAQGSIIVKVAVESSGGMGIRIWNSQDGMERLEKCLSGRDFIIQELVSQHESLSALHPSSVNTLRIISLIWEGEVRILSRILRMGTGGSNVDNASSGGLFIGIDGQHNLREFAYRMDGGRCTSHPDTGVVFKGYHVPGIDRCDAIIHREAWRLAHTCKLASWDFCIGEDGEPILIEVNMSYGGISLHQITNGPLFGPLTREIVDTVFGGKKGKRLVQRIF